MSVTSLHIDGADCACVDCIGVKAALTVGKASHGPLSVVPGVGKDEPIVADAKGYKSSRTPYRFDCAPNRAALRIAAISAEGASSHGAHNWKKGTVEDHLNKMLAHAYAYMAGDRSDDHLGHMAWRASAALDISLGTEYPGDES